MLSDVNEPPHFTERHTLEETWATMEFPERIRNLTVIPVDGG